jgi:hypothetical protein
VGPGCGRAGWGQRRISSTLLFYFLYAINKICRVGGIFKQLKIKKGETNMKTKKFNKKLTLNKATIADLHNGEMGKIQGGFDNTNVSKCLACLETTYSDCLSQCPPGGAAC